MKNNRKEYYIVITKNPYYYGNIFSKIKKNYIFKLEDFIILCFNSSKSKIFLDYKNKIKNVKNTKVLKVKFYSKIETIEKTLLTGASGLLSDLGIVNVIKLKVLKDLTKEAKSNLIFA